MAEVSDIISSLEKKVRELVKAHDSLRHRNNILSAELGELKNMLDVQKQTIKNLEEKNKIIKLAKSLTESEAKDSAEMKYKINEIVREIDKCIAQLNS